jgi:hypothetical protein
MNSCQIFRLPKLLTNITKPSCETVKKKHFQTSNKLAKPKHQLDHFSDLSDKNCRFKIF